MGLSGGGGGGGGVGGNIHCAPTSGGTLSIAHYEHVQHFTSLCSAELRDQMALKRSQTTCMLDFLLPAKRQRYLAHSCPLEVSHFKPTHASSCVACDALFPGGGVGQDHMHHHLV